MRRTVRVIVLSLSLMSLIAVAVAAASAITGDDYGNPADIHDLDGDGLINDSELYMAVRNYYSTYQVHGLTQEEIIDLLLRSIGDISKDTPTPETSIVRRPPAPTPSGRTPAPTPTGTLAPTATPIYSQPGEASWIAHEFDVNRNGYLEEREMWEAIDSYYSSEGIVSRDHLFELLIRLIGRIHADLPTPIEPPREGPPTPNILDCTEWKHGRFSGDISISTGSSNSYADITLRNPDHYRYPKWAYGFGWFSAGNPSAGMQFIGVTHDEKWVHQTLPSSSFNPVKRHAGGDLPIEAEFDTDAGALNRITYDPPKYPEYRARFYVNGHLVQEWGNWPVGGTPPLMVRAFHVAIGYDGDVPRAGVHHMQYENLCVGKETGGSTQNELPDHLPGWVRGVSY